MKFDAIITAGGTSSRFGHTNKLLEKVHAKEIIIHTVEKFLAIEEIGRIIICANISIINILKKFFKNEPKIQVIEGGNTRQQSVYNGLLVLQNTDYVLIHDGARPIVSEKTIRKILETVQKKSALTLATKTTDTIKQVDKNHKIVKTIDRNSLYNTQTPQAFKYKLIKEAHEKFKGQNFTDDAGMLEALGQEVYILEGDYKNIKITKPNDIDIAKIYLS